MHMIAICRYHPILLLDKIVLFFDLINLVATVFIEINVKQYWNMQSYNSNYEDLDILVW